MRAREDAHAFDELDGQNRHDEANQHGARVSHENAGGSSVKPQESQERTRQAETKDRVLGETQEIEPEPKGGRSHDPDRARETVDPVDEIEGVRHHHTREDGEDVAKPNWKIPDTEQSVERRELNAGEVHENDCSDDLSREFFPGPQIYQIIFDAHEEQHQDRADDVLEFEDLRLIRPEGDGKKQTGKNGHSA